MSQSGKISGEADKVEEIVEDIGISAKTQIFSKILLITVSLVLVFVSTLDSMAKEGLTRRSFMAKAIIVYIRCRVML